ncbi:MAG: hypothetical protein LBJ60_07880 [Tannerellaceae bacterium]|jgi:hypothetical protein|nr:hypothetical protein [Tannerellaceae bacterium]
MSIFNLFRGKDKSREAGYPKELMTDVYWAFYGGTYSSEKDFVQAVDKYHTELERKAEWRPGEVALQSKEVIILYSYWDENEDDEVEADFSLVADKNFFTAGELLFKIHNKVVENLQDDDHHFFEGLTLYTENGHETHIPGYALMQGS